MKHFLFFFSLFIGHTCLHSQANLPQDRPKLLSGPMLGYAEMREASIWIQSSTSVTCHIKFWPKGSENIIIKKYVDATEANGNTVEFVLSGLEPGTTYQYVVNVGGYLGFEGEKEFSTQPLWQYRTEPPDFKIAFGSCVFVNEPLYDRPGDGYGGGYEIFSSINAMNPDLMLWGGDNVYFREVDWNSRSGMIHRYTHSRSVAELKPLLSSCPHYAIWDDHDFGPNDSNGSFSHKLEALEVFDLFWANNGSGADGLQDNSSQFTWGDVDFFLLDNRSHRTDWNIKGTEPTILGDEQITWLIAALKFSKAPFKMVAMGGQFLNSSAKYENYANWGIERQKIIDLIGQNNITGVVFLTGDRHCTEFSKLTLDSGIAIYDLTVSPLTSSFFDISKEENTLRVDGTIVAERNFSILSFSGKRKERVLKMEVFDAKGKLKWEQTIAEPNLEKK